MDFKLRNSFPEGFKPNHAQEVIINGIEEALERNERFIIINAPTGSGKSFISKMMANYSSPIDPEFKKMLEETVSWGKISVDKDYRFGTAILTCTKNLQDQYAALFKDGSVLKGKINYECSQDQCPCDIGPCCAGDEKLKDKCWANRECPYYNARFDTCTNKCSFYNYSMFLSLEGPQKYKDFIVCDEASELEDEIVGEYTIEFDLVKLKEAMGARCIVLPDEGSPDIEYKNFVKDMAATLKDMITEFFVDRKTGKRRKVGPAGMKKYHILYDAFYNFDMLAGAWDLSEWFKIHGERTIKFMPYQVDKLAQRFFYYGKHVILMSATIVNVKNFAQTLGIRHYAYIDAPSSFDPGRAYITGWKEKFRPNFKNKLQLIPKMAEAAKKVCEKYSDKKGIIHTNSFEILYILKKVLGGGNKRFLYRSVQSSNQDLLESHKITKEPTVLVSPSMTHGVDLKGDLGEFQIIMKAPYPSLSDPRVKRKFDEDKEWYQDKMLSTLVQACGRCNRTKEDLSITFILDFNAYESLVINRHKLPYYFQQRMTGESGQRYVKFFKEKEEQS